MHGGFPNWTDIENHLLSDLIFVVLGGLLTLIIAPLRRKLLLKFFGLSKVHALKIYLSNITVMRGGSTGVDGKSRSFSGAAIPNVEFEPVPQALRVLNKFTGSDKVTNRIANVIFQLDPKDVSVEISPREVSGQLDSNLVLVGGPGYNAYTVAFGALPDHWLTLTMDGIVIIEKGPSKGKRFHNTMSNDMGIIERLYDKESGAAIFITAGGNVNGTRGAFEYLFKHWRQLAKKYKDKPFAMCLRFPQHFNDPSGYKKPTILYTTEPEPRGIEYLKQFLRQRKGDGADS